MADAGVPKKDEVIHADDLEEAVCGISSLAVSGVRYHTYSTYAGSSTGIFNSVSSMDVGDDTSLVEKKALTDSYYSKTDLPSVLLDKLYPVGSVYISIANTSPASFLGGTWSKINAGYALWTASSGAGNTVSAGLPNITGTWNSTRTETEGGYNGGAVYFTGINNLANTEKINNAGLQLGFDASKCSSVYGSSDTVQPPAYKVYAWKRTA